MYQKIILIFVIPLLLCGCAHSINKQAAHYNAQLSLLYSREGAYPNARIKAFKALDLDPKSEQALFAVAYYAQQTKQTPLAKKYYRKALKIAPNSGELNSYYAQFLCGQQEYIQALKYFDKAILDVTYGDISNIFEKAAHCALKIPDKTLADNLFLKARENRAQQ